jgi:hypothetical protein
MSRQTVLLIFVAVLLVLKFGVMPLREEIAENSAIIASLKERVGKGNALIATEQTLLEQEATLDEFLGDTKGSFPIVPAPEITQLQFQRMVRNAADKHNVSIESQEWTRYEEGIPSAAWFRVRVASSLENFPGFLLDMESIGQWVELDELNLDVANQDLRIKRLGLTTGRLIFKINYIVEENSSGL